MRPKLAKNAATKGSKLMSGSDFPVPFPGKQIFGNPYVWRRKNLARVIEAGATQGNTCPVCHKPPAGRWGVLEIDHCHMTGFVRGLLCHDCNIGRFSENSALHRRYADYLDFHDKMIASYQAATQA